MYQQRLSEVTCNLNQGELKLSGTVEAALLFSRTVEAAHSKANNSSMITVYHTPWTDNQITEMFSPDSLSNMAALSQCDHSLSGFNFQISIELFLTRDC
jgi:hypothetical protein